MTIKSDNTDTNFDLHIFLCRGKSRWSAVKSYKSFLTWSTCLQSFLRSNLTIALSLFLPSQWESSMNSGAMVQPTFWKSDRTFASRSLSSTWRGVPTTSTHSFLEYWVFVQHWHSNVTIRLVSTILTNSCREFLLKVRKIFVKLRHFFQHFTFASDILLYNDLLCSSSENTIGISSPFNSLSNDSSVHWSMVIIVAR